MAKRYTDTEKWKREWFRNLPDKQRLFWIFLCDACDFTGVWIEDFETASLWLRHPISKDDYAAFGDRIVRLCKDKVFIPRFIEFQYGVLKDSCSPHRAVIRELKKRGIDPVTLTVTQGYLGTLKDKDKDKDQDQEKDQDQDKRGIGGDFPPLTRPAPTPGWENASTLDQTIQKLRDQGQEAEAQKLESWVATLQKYRGPMGVSA